MEVFKEFTILEQDWKEIQKMEMDGDRWAVRAAGKEFGSNSHCWGQVSGIKLDSSNVNSYKINFQQTLALPTCFVQVAQKRSFKKVPEFSKTGND